MSRICGRGRPRGSYQYDDTTHLDAVAELMVGNPTLKKTRAISMIVQKEFSETKWSASERRLLRKWNETGKERLEAAEIRRQKYPRHSRFFTRSSLPFHHLQDSRGALAEAALVHTRLELIQDIIDPPAIHFLREQEKMRRQIRDLIDPPQLRQIREDSELLKQALGHF